EIATRRRHRGRRGPGAGLLVICFHRGDNGAARKTRGATYGVDDAMLSGRCREAEPSGRHRCDQGPGPCWPPLRGGRIAALPGTRRHVQISLPEPAGTLREEVQRRAIEGERGRAIE